MSREEAGESCQRTQAKRQTSCRTVYPPSSWSSPSLERRTSGPPFRPLRPLATQRRALVVTGRLGQRLLHLLKEPVDRLALDHLLARLAHLGLLGREVDRRRLVRREVGRERAAERGRRRRGRGRVELLDGREGGRLGLGCMRDGARESREEGELGRQQGEEASDMLDRSPESPLSSRKGGTKGWSTHGLGSLVGLELLDVEVLDKVYISTKRERAIIARQPTSASREWGAHAKERGGGGARGRGQRAAAAADVCGSPHLKGLMMDSEREARESERTLADDRGRERADRRRGGGGAGLEQVGWAGRRGDGGR